MIGNFSYEAALLFAQTWGAVYFAIMFLVALVYACWPANGETFRRAATSLFREEDAP